VIWHWLTVAETHLTIIGTGLANLAYLRYMHMSLRGQINGGKPDRPPS
jgi:hypothetical protein